MSLWTCPKHGLYGPGPFCPGCGTSGSFATIKPEEPMTPKALEPVELLPDAMPGHWDTPEGREIALEYASKSRDELAYGDRSDLAIANAVYMANRDDLNLIHYQEAAKQRIRWLSVQLAIARAALEAAQPLPDIEKVARAIIVCNRQMVGSVEDYAEADRILVSNDGGDAGEAFAARQLAQAAIEAMRGES